ncbi:hypothetical protein Kpol_1032p40 [Vanderwaltozyma polyspora DSM 70294]|uniref:Uncharacterized protein n=1 Tax=Vanderwaltozyma polyspora (strain ATCC 22028 / DSM 70294 / BCRC 21397 / CBS 2163 / NBRC 10782 / NRRL Y-8283 / UCD 57-17) TaxID=436907 RepID=A7TGZ4_VANPO|nr:uncharacterized protein Kpol_1032p40 [Vanderwaltozyma polyspora DSM 70294]EDO18446.1 hypothetical protein Kpol_1032p40 [Vanderwaltozyma polyspora DSM 70294]
MSPVSKKIKIANNMVKQICTHSNSFHADEALAVYMLRLLPEYSDAKVVRSRDPAMWEDSDIVVDVSGKYDGIKFFDHHQREFYETFSENYKTKLSSAGLVFKHFGRDIISSILTGNASMDSNKLDILYERVYKNFVEAIDANDNGINCYDVKGTDIEPKFIDKSITIPAVISNMNPDWNDDCSPEKFDENFFMASKFIGDIFFRLVKRYGDSWLPAKDLVEQAIKNRLEVDPSGKIILFDQFCPWKEHLYAVEKELGIENQIQFVLFQDSGKTWRVSTVPVSSTSFEFRKGLPEELRGLRDDELSEKSGVPGCVFIHAAGFIGGAKSKDAVLKLAKMSL